MKLELVSDSSERISKDCPFRDEAGHAVFKGVRKMRRDAVFTSEEDTKTSPNIAST